LEKAAEMKRKQSESKKGKSTSRKGKGHKKQLIEKYGKTEGEKIYHEMIQKQRISHIGKSSPMKNKKHSSETKQKISVKISGNNHPNFGKKLSDELIIKLSKPKNTKQKQKLIDNPSLKDKILDMRKNNIGYNNITKKTGINYFLIKEIETKNI
jgi:hypothetical protein